MMQSFTVEIIDDDVVEYPESFFVELSNASNSTISVLDAAMVTISENDSAALTLDDISVTEGNADGVSTIEAAARSWSRKWKTPGNCLPGGAPASCRTT